VRALLVLILACPTALALNKQGARSADEDGPSKTFDVQGYVFFGGFIFNPSYAARPNNTGRAAFRYGLHLDVDLYHQWLTLSYDENTFTDSSASSPGLFLPSEHDHILGLLSTIPFKHGFALTLALHYEIDASGHEPQPQPAGYVAGYSQSYADIYARASWDRGPVSLAVALGGFLYNQTYAARADNAGIALLRYVLHGELRALPWLTLRLDLNSFTDRDQFPLTPTELDVTSEIGVRVGKWELRFIGEADLNLGRYPATGAHPAPSSPGLQQFYLALLLQWSFDSSTFAVKGR
jgi:hypothetical protein